MDIYKRLLFALIGIAVTMLALFGALSYRVAIDAGTASEAALLQRLVLAQAERLDADRDVGIADLPLAFGHDYRISVIDAAGRRVAGADMAAGLPGSIPPLTGRDHHGRSEHGGGYLIWAMAPLANSDQRLVLIHRSDLSPWAVFRRIGKPLLAAALVICVFAIGGGLLLAKLIARRLARQHAQLLHQAEHDKLTGLASRDSLHQRLTALIQNPEANCPPLALLVMDLNRFKEINDTLGHKIGDDVLRQVAHHLGRALPDIELSARLGGDEFALLLFDAKLHDALAVAQQAQAALLAVVRIRDIEINVQASVGIALFPEHGVEADVLIRCAEVAMYNAKRQGVNHAVYSPDLDPYNVRRLTLMSDLRHAIEQQQLALYYQPKVDLRTHRTVGVEALLRWRHPVHGFIPPADFVPLAEQCDLIRPLTYWILDEALRQGRAWRQLGLSLDVAVNLSARNLHDPGLPAKVAGLLAKWSVPAAHLTLEITENAIMVDPPRALKILDRLHAMGIKLSIDDFGTGYSSLVYLKKLPVTQIKIDRSFVMDMVCDENDAIIVRSTIDLGHNLGCHIVAEGVESKEILEHLKDLGCDYAQGYYLSRPVSPADLLSWLAASAWASPDVAATGPRAVETISRSA